MRRSSPSAAFVAVSALVWGCTTYDSSLVPTNDSLIAMGGDVAVAGGGATATAGNTNSAAGKGGTTDGGTANAGGQAGTTSGGTGAAPESGTAGEPPTPTSGAGGVAGGGGTDGGAGRAGMASAAGAGGTASAAGSGGAGGSAGAVSKGGAGGTAGAAGTGGGAAVVKCADHPIPAKTTWVASASDEELGNGTPSDGLYNPAKQMIDGIDTKRWSTGKAQDGTEWIQIDFGVTVNLTQVTLVVVGNDATDYPRMYEVRMSNTTGAPGAPIVASGAGMSGNTVIDFASPVTGQFLKINQTGKVVLPDKYWWTIGELNVACSP